MKPRVRALALVALLTALAMPPTTLAAPGGNSAAAQACQQGGYVNYARQDGTHFSNTGDCVRYATGNGGAVALVPLPDFVSSVSCRWLGDENSDACDVSITNIGAPYSMPVGLSIVLAPGYQVYVAYASGCDAATIDADSSYHDPPRAGSAVLVCTLDSTGAANASIGLRTYSPSGPNSPGAMTGTATATANPDGAVNEAKTDNNSAGAGIPDCYEC